MAGEQAELPLSLRIVSALTVLAVAVGVNVGVGMVVKRLQPSLGDAIQSAVDRTFWAAFGVLPKGAPSPEFLLAMPPYLQADQITPEHFARWRAAAGRQHVRPLETVFTVRTSPP